MKHSALVNEPPHTQLYVRTLDSVSQVYTEAAALKQSTNNRAPQR